MNALTKRELTSMKTVVRFLNDNVINPAIPRATAARAILESTIGDLESADQLQFGGAGQSAGGVAARRFHAKQLREYLKAINLTARELEEEMPGVSEKFRLPKSATYAALKTAAQTIITEATPVSAALVEHGLSADFLTEVGDLLTAFEEATGEKSGGVLKRKTGTASLRYKAKRGMAAVKRLNACVRNHFRAQPPILEAWDTARRVERAPRSTAEAPATPAPAPAPTVA